jgi:hypothetical protein
VGVQGQGGEGSGYALRCALCIVCVSVCCALCFA